MQATDVGFFLNGTKQQAGPSKVAQECADVNVFLLQYYLGAEWPPSLLFNLAKLVNAYHENKKIFDKEPRKFFMNVLLDATKNAANNSMEENVASIILAILLQEKTNSLADEANYLSYCANDPVTTGKTLCQFQAVIAVENEGVLLDVVLSKILLNQSLCLAMLTKFFKLNPIECEMDNFNSVIQSKIMMLAKSQQSDMKLMW